MISKLKKIVIRLKIKFSDQYSIIPIFRQQGATIGTNCRIYIKALAGEPYFVKIGNHVTIAAEVRLLTHDGAVWVGRGKNQTINNFGTIEIKDNCFIGTRAIILPNKTIGPNSIVGAGAVVTKDVPPNAVVAGNPAKYICTVDEYLNNVNTLQLFPDLEKAVSCEKDMDNIHEHLTEEYIKKVWATRK